MPVCRTTPSYSAAFLRFIGTGPLSLLRTRVLARCSACCSFYFIYATTRADGATVSARILARLTIRVAERPYLPVPACGGIMRATLPFPGCARLPPRTVILTTYLPVLPLPLPWFICQHRYRCCRRHLRRSWFAFFTSAWFRHACYAYAHYTFYAARTDVALPRRMPPSSILAYAYLPHYAARSFGSHLTYLRACAAFTHDVCVAHRATVWLYALHISMRVRHWRHAYACVRNMT